MKRSLIIAISFFLFELPVLSQSAVFSLSTDLDLQHSIKKGQQYWAAGQTIQGYFNFTPKEGAYIWLSYYSNGRFKNDLTATAKSPVTTPQQVAYTNSAVMRFRQISMGWKHYFKGASDMEDGWGLYGYAGFGLLLGKVSNTHSVSIDTLTYQVPVLSGEAGFKRLTFDLGLGWEVPLGGDLFFYTEGRVWIPTTDYPSRYVFINNNAPFVASLDFGIRILFD